MRNRDFKDALFEQLARVASAFAAPKRIEFVDLLALEHHCGLLARDRDIRLILECGLVSVEQA